MHNIYKKNNCIIKIHQTLLCVVLSHKITLMFVAMMRHSSRLLFSVWKGTEKWTVPFLREETEVSFQTLHKQLFLFLAFWSLSTSALSALSHTGYRHVPLLNRNGDKLPSAGLFVHVMVLDAEWNTRLRIPPTPPNLRLLHRNKPGPCSHNNHVFRFFLVSFRGKLTYRSYCSSLKLDCKSNTRIMDSLSAMLQTQWV